MPSNRTPTRVYGPAYITTTPATLYTVPSGKIAVIRLITVLGGNADTAIFGINGFGGSEDFFLEVAVAQDESVNVWEYQVLAATDTLQAAANSGDTNVVVTVNADVYDA